MLEYDYNIGLPHLIFSLVYISSNIMLEHTRRPATIQPDQCPCLHKCACLMFTFAKVTDAEFG